MCLLNAGDVDAAIDLTVYYTDQEPVGPYAFRMPGQRSRHVRFNDLVDPEPLLGRPFGCMLTSSVLVAVQFQRQDTRLPGVIALTGAPAYAAR